MNKVQCQCTKCNCQDNFIPIDQELFLNLVSHGRLTQKQIDLIKKRVGSTICKRCFIGLHQK